MKLKLGLAGLTLMLAGCYSAYDVKNHQDEKTVSTVKEAPKDKSAQMKQIASPAAVDEKSHLTSTFYFQYDKSTLDDTNKKLLLAVADFLVKHPDAKIEIVGHTDIRGTREYNQSLGQRRATAVAQCLEEHGVRPDQIQVVSHGKEHLLSASENDQAQALNRRVEIIFKK